MATLQQIEQGIKVLAARDPNDPQIRVLAAERKRLLAEQQNITQPETQPGQTGDVQKAAGYATIDPASRLDKPSILGPGTMPLPGSATGSQGVAMPAMALQPPGADVQGLPVGENVQANAPAAAQLTQQQQRLAEFARQARGGSAQSQIGPAPRDPYADERMGDKAIWQLQNKGSFDPNYSLSPSERVKDFHDSVMSGIGRLATTTVGLPGTIQQAMPAVGAKINEYLGYTPEQIEKFRADATKDMESKRFLPNIEETSAFAEGIQPGSVSYRSPTTAGRYSQNVASFGGLGGIAKQGVKSFLRYSVAPGIGSQFAYDASGGAPYSYLAGALLAPASAKGIGSLATRTFDTEARAIRAAIRNAPTPEALTRTTNDLYGLLRRQGIQYDPATFQRTILDAARELHGAGFRRVTGMEQPFDWLRQLQQTGRGGRSPDFNDINAIRTQIGAAARQAYSNPATHSLGRALDIIQDHLDDFEGHAPFTSATGISGAALDTARNTARDLALRRIKQRALDEIFVKADTYRAGRDSGLRNGIGNLLRSKRGLQLFPPGSAERQMLLDVEHGNKPLNVLGKFGYDIMNRGGNASLLPALGSMAMASGGFLGGGVVPAALLATAGTAAKTALPYLTERGLNQAGATIRSAALRNRRGRPAQSWWGPGLLAGVGAPTGVYGLASDRRNE